MKIFEIGTTIKKLRKEKGMTQEALANLANISRVTLGKLERGQMGAVSVVTLDIILDALGYELEFKSKEGFGIPVFGE
jgi:transcriptional regulator with XRE-family HTH domain